MLLTSSSFSVKSRWIPALALLGLSYFGYSPLGHGQTAGELPAVRDFISEMVARYNFDNTTLNRLFERVNLHPEIIDTMTRPAEAKPWHEYRNIFLTQARIDGGVEFWREQRAALERAKAEYGVDPAIIVAIIGVETRYGTRTGTYRVIEALSTLAFQYPKRAPFFRTQLMEYLLLTRQEGFDPLELKGSYAGAMGLPQFMPSSFREFAVDLDKDGRRDLWNNPADAIGSVANYLARHDWQPGEPIAIAVRLTNDAKPDSLVDAGLKPTLPFNRVWSAGLLSDQKIPGDSLTAVLRLEGETGPEYWLGLQNFYAITRYNHSPLYAMAVYQLSQAITAQLATTLSSTKGLR